MAGDRRTINRTGGDPACAYESLACSHERGCKRLDVAHRVACGLGGCCVLVRRRLVCLRACTVHKLCVCMSALLSSLTFQPIHTSVWSFHPSPCGQGI